MNEFNLTHSLVRLTLNSADNIRKAINIRIETNGENFNIVQGWYNSEKFLYKHFVNKTIFPETHPHTLAKESISELKTLIQNSISDI